jgi:hypothetical protein
MNEILLFLMVVITLFHYYSCTKKSDKILRILEDNFKRQADNDIRKII